MAEDESNSVINQASLPTKAPRHNKLIVFTSVSVAKYKSLKLHKKRAYDWLRRVFQANPTLFEYWKVFKVC
ncbi:hypothetical protein KAR34_00055 [bacterium]|nr:hypothetical protein [bacterium]